MNADNHYPRSTVLRKGCGHKRFLCDQWISRYEHAILENALFYIVVEDNEWSVAIKLIQKEDWLLNLDGLQAKHYQSYLNGMKDCLFEQFDELGTYGGPWTSGRIRKVAS